MKKRRQLAAVLVSALMMLSSVTAASAEGEMGTESQNRGNVAVEALRFKSHPTLEGAITEDVWGDPTIHVDGSSANSELYKYSQDCPDDLSMDIYLRYDETDFYIGVVTPDDSYLPSKSDAPWDGDAIQFRLDPQGDVNPLSSDAINISLGQDAVGNKVIRNHTASQNMDGSVMAFDKAADGTLSFMVKIPHSLLEIDPWDDFTYGISIGRVSGSAGGTEKNGWLTWGGNIFGSSNVTLHGSNACYFSLEPVNGRGNTTVKALKFPSPPTLEGAITKDVWGDPTIHVDGSSANSELYKYSQDCPDDLSMDIYLRYDETDFYIGVVTPDDSYLPSKSDAPWDGDAIQFRLDPQGDVNPLSSDAINVSLGQDAVGNKVIRNHTASQNMDGSVMAFDKAADGTLSFMVKIPHSLLDVTLRNTFTYGISIGRVSGSAGGTEKNGWLTWGGNIFGSSNVALKGSNACLLIGQGSEIDPQPGEDDRLQNVSVSANVNTDPAATEDFGEMRLCDTKNGVYAVYISKVKVVEKASVINRFVLVKIEGKTSKVIYTGYTPNHEVDLFSDENGMLYIVGGASSFPESDNVTKQNASLHVWRYDPASGNTTGYSTRSLAFADERPYEYATAVLMNGKIYGLFTGGDCLVWFSFDMAARTWDDAVKQVSVPDGITSDSLYAVADQNGMSVLYGEPDKTAAMLTIVGFKTAEGEAVQLPEGASFANGSDVFRDTNGNLHILYTVGQKAMHAVYNAENGAFSSSELTGLTDRYYLRMLQTTGGAFRILAMPKDKAAVELWSSADGSAFAKQFETAFKGAKAATASGLTIANTRNHSLVSDMAKCFFPVNNKWFYYELDLDETGK